MATTTGPVITFRAKIVETEAIDSDTVVERRIKVPALTASHYDNNGTRMAGEPLGGGSAMAQRMFAAWLARAARAVGVTPGGYLDLDALPASVTVDTSGFLAVVTVRLEG